MDKQTYEQQREELILQCRQHRYMIPLWGKKHPVLVRGKVMTLYDAAKYFQEKLAELRNTYYKK